MFKLGCILARSANSACRQITASLSAKGLPLCESSVLRRTLCSEAAEPKKSSASSSKFSYLPPLPGQDSPLRWKGKKFEELPIVHIKVTFNNTHMHLTDCTGQSLVRTSCGVEGFKNTKKSTPIASHSTGLSLATKSLKIGVPFVRVVFKGFGPRRQSALQGMTLGGLKVVSITDNTPLPHNGCKARKPRRT